MALSLRTPGSPFLAGRSVPFTLTPPRNPVIMRERGRIFQPLGGVKSSLMTELLQIAREPEFLQIPGHLLARQGQLSFQLLDLLLHGQDIDFLLFLESVHVARD